MYYNIRFDKGVLLTKMPIDQSSIWELYGIKTNPFFTDPLLIFSGIIDLKIGFVGREEEVKRLRNIIYNNVGTRILVSGDVGIGKTTFVNYFRAKAQQDKFFTVLKEIAVQPGWNSTDFILNTLSAIYHTLKVRTDLDSSLIKKELLRKLELLVDIVENKDRNYSLSINGIGGGIGKATSLNVPSQNIHSLQLFFEQITEEIIIKGFKGLIFHYNNLEVLEIEELQKLFQSIRDFLQTKNAHFILIGDLKVPQIVTQIKRVNSVMSDTPIILGNLTLKEVKLLLENRIKQLASPYLNVIKPYEEEVIARLYDLYDGNLRFILHSLSTVFQELIRDNPIIITNKELTHVLSEVAKKRWLMRLTDWEKEILFLMLKEDEMNNKKIAEKLKKQKQNISKVTNKLLDLCAIRIKRIEGKEKFFTVEHSIKWFLLEDNKRISEKRNRTTKEIQKILEF